MRTGTKIVKSVYSRFLSQTTGSFHLKFGTQISHMSTSFHGKNQPNLSWWLTGLFDFMWNDPDIPW